MASEVMLAYRFLGAGIPLRLEEVPIPRARPGWVVIRVAAAGLCHSDLHIMDGAPFNRVLPVTLGHEVAGVITELGAGVEGWSVGDRVGVSPMLSGSSPGLSIDGGFAEYCHVPAATLIAIPEGVSFESAAVGTDSVATAFHAVRTTGAVRLGDTVVIIGLGGLGLNAVRVAALSGARVYGIDRNAETHAAAMKHGAVECRQGLTDLDALRPDVVIDFVGVSETLNAALAAGPRGGRVVLVGLDGNETKIDTRQFVVGRKSLLASLGYETPELAEVYQLLAQGELVPVVESIPFDRLEEGCARLRSGDVRGRLVTSPGQGNPC